MRILHVADLHFDLRQLGWVFARADEFDGVVIAGDLLSLGAGVPVTEQISQTKHLLERIAGKTNLMICSGNHDLDHRIADGERVADWLHLLDTNLVFVDGEPCSLGSWLFSLCPWTDGPETAEFVRNHLDDTVPGDGQTWVWLHHAPPADTRISTTGRRDHGDSTLVRAIHRRQPQIVLSGHVHQAPFVGEGCWYDIVGGTLVMNPGRQDGEWPAHIELDAEDATATWRSVAGVESVSIGEHLTFPVAAQEASGGQ